MRNKWVIGNWKMNPNAEDAKLLFECINSTNYKSDVKVGIAPPSVYLASFLEKKKKHQTRSIKKSTKKILTEP